ncbi:MAG TPA: hypothetical protein DCX07_09715 [Phycisphaerales bacterium]|nr:hypothetical protein [Phycisphaerales bacterium]
MPSIFRWSLNLRATLLLLAISILRRVGVGGQPPITNRCGASLARTVLLGILYWHWRGSGPRRRWSWRTRFLTSPFVVGCSGFARRAFLGHRVRYG